MKQILWIFLLAGFTSTAQSYTIDTLPNAAAYANSFTLLPFTGTTSDGGKYIAGFNQQVDKNGKQLDLELVRIDLSNKSIQYKKMNGFTGGKGYYWTYTFDKPGNLYLSMFYPGRKVLQLNLRDSITFKDLGNPFKNGASVIYSLSTGTDENVYFGGSISGTCWSEYNPATKQMKKHPVVDPANDYVISITGDKDYVYMQTGQRKSINLWSVNKHTEEKKLLFSVPNTTRFDVAAFTDAVYASINTDTLKGSFKLVNGTAVKPGAIPKDRKMIPALYEPGHEVNEKQVSYFDPITSQVYFSPDKKNYDSVYIRNTPERMSIRRMFSFPNDKENIYYAGDYYGNYYRYNIREQKAYLLGATGYNIYSSLALNDSMIYLSGYPSGFLMLWNKNKPWTANKFINGKIMDIRDANANPKILHYWKGEGKPAAGFHHTFQMVKDSRGNLIGAGDVIRIGNAASIGVYNAASDNIYGIDYGPYSGLNFASITVWNDKVLYSTRSNNTRKPKIYFYDPVANKMTDSIDLGFKNYGKLFIQHDTLTGIADNMIYRIALTQKKLLWNYSFADNAIGGSYFLHDGRFIVNTTSKLPAQLTNFTALPVANYLEANNIFYAITGNNIVRIRWK